MVSLICPSCGARLTIENEFSREFAFCEYCGARLSLKEKADNTIRYIDEARLREAELNAQVRMRELELESDINRRYEERVASNRKFFKKRLPIYLIVGIGAMILAGLLSVVISFKVLYPLVIIGSIAICCAFYGSIGHGIAMLVKRDKR